MSSVGYIQLRAYTSYAQIPLKDVAITITDPEGTAIAMRLTDRNGQIRPVEISVPEKSESLSPGSAEAPYAIVNLYAYLDGYEMIESENLQVFPDTTTFQDLEMIPLAQYPGLEDPFIHYLTPPQNL